MAAEDTEQIGGIMHCFVDDWQTAERALELNFLISFSGIVTFKTATELKEVARCCPLDKMLVETDAPYLTPVPYRGKSNQPQRGWRHSFVVVERFRQNLFRRVL